MFGLSPQQILFLLILIAAIVLFISEWIRPDIVAVMVIVALYVARVLEPKDALSGFSSEPAMVIAGIFVLSASLHATGLSDMIGGWIGRFAGRSLTRAIAVIMPSVALMSAFTHHVTTTAMMVPVTLDLSRERDMPASKLLMPMSFAASLGTTITIIGAPLFCWQAPPSSNLDATGSVSSRLLRSASRCPWSGRCLFCLWVVTCFQVIEPKKIARIIFVWKIT